MDTDEKYPTYPNTIKMLQDNDIDYTNVIVDGFCVIGYYTFVRDENGNKIIRPGHTKNDRLYNPWPTEEMAFEAMKAFDADYRHNEGIDF